MKVLLLGEFSSFHKNLKEGLHVLGHEVIIAANSDGYKKIPVDISFDKNLPSPLGGLEARARILMNLPRLKGYDVVQLMNPFLYKFKYFPTDFFYRFIKENNSKFFMLAAGSDSYFWNYGRKHLAYGPFEDTLKYDHGKTNVHYESEDSLRFNKKIADMVRGVIPIMYEYEVSYDKQFNKLPTIPIPMNTDKIEYRDNDPGSKLVVFHGLSRYGFKGTRFVEEAFRILKKKYPNDLELAIEGKMPLDDYLKLMRKTNVVIDQVHSYSCGVNGVYALAMGKVVLGGAEPESLKSLGVSESPVINIKPDVDNIVRVVEGLLERRSDISTQGYASRQFAEKIHGYVKVASQYLETWRQN